MALSYSTLTATTREVFMKVLENNIYNSSVTLKTLLMDGSVEQRGGRKVVEPLLYAKNTAVGRFQGMEPVDITIPDNITASEYNWGHYYASIGISRDDELQNSGDAQVLNLIKERTNEAEMALKDYLTDDLFFGTSTKGIIGLNTAVGTGTYGGIAVADFSGWVSGVNTTSYTEAQLLDSSASTYVHKLFQAADRSCLHLGESPNLIVTTPLIWDIYESSITPSDRYPKTGRGKKIASAGYDVLEWRSRPIVKDEKCPAGYVYFLNTTHMKIRIDPQENFYFTGFKEATNQIGKVGQILFKGQLCLNNRRMHYKFTGFPQS